MRTSEQISEWIRQEELKQRDESLVAFLAIREQVRDAMEDGYAAKTVWRYMQASKKIAFCYDTFLKYVKHFQCRPQRKRASKLAAPKSPPLNRTTGEQSKASDQAPVTKAGKPVAPAGFIFNPIPNKEELL